LAGDGDRISGDETGGGLCELVLCAGVVGQLRGGGVDGGALGCHAHAGCGCAQGVVVIAQSAIGAGSQRQSGDGVQGLCGLHILAGQVGCIAAASDSEGFTRHAGGCQVRASERGACVIDPCTR
jgi:hypothetical protein